VDVEVIGVIAIFFNGDLVAISDERAGMLRGTNILQQQEIQ